MANYNHWTLGTEEYATVVEKPKDSKWVKVYLGKVLPLVGGPAKAKTWPESVSNGICINDSQCKPSISSTIQCSNFHKLPVRCEMNPETTLYGTPVRVTVVNHSTTQMCVDGIGAGTWDLLV